MSFTLKMCPLLRTALGNINCIYYISPEVNVTHDRTYKPAEHTDDCVLVTNLGDGSTPSLELDTLLMVENSKHTVDGRNPANQLIW